MALGNKGLTKLIEECGEVIQAAAKRIELPEGENIHWDGSDLRERLADEIADATAACTIVTELWQLEPKRILSRYYAKLDLFRYWAEGGTETKIPNAEVNKNGTGT
jgi:NTP pyrophosphatase (non-canonical NTP hydrolase)